MAGSGWVGCLVWMFRTAHLLKGKKGKVRVSARRICAGEAFLSTIALHVYISSCKGKRRMESQAWIALWHVEEIRRADMICKVINVLKRCAGT